jgi:hypothetical protein
MDGMFPALMSTEQRAWPGGRGFRVLVGTPSRCFALLLYPWHFVQGHGHLASISSPGGFIWQQ